MTKPASGGCLSGARDAAYLAIIMRQVILPLSARPRTRLAVVIRISARNDVSLLLFLNQSVVNEGDPSTQPAVELVLGAVCLDGDVFIVESGKGNALVLVELLRVGRKRPVLGFFRHCDSRS